MYGTNRYTVRRHWLIGHFDFAAQLCRMGRLSPELMDEMRACAKEKDDHLSIMLIEPEAFLHPEQRNTKVTKSRIPDGKTIRDQTYNILLNRPSSS